MRTHITEAEFFNRLNEKRKKAEGRTPRWRRHNKQRECNFRHKESRYMRRHLKGVPV